MNGVLKIARREFLRIWNDSRLRSVVLLAPFLYAGLFCFVYSKHTLTELPIAVYGQDSSAPARQLVRMLESSQKLHIVKYVSSVPELQELIYSNSIDAAIVIPPNFTRQIKRGHNTRVVAYVNAASMVSANIAAKAINEVVQTFSAGVEIKKLMKKGSRLADAMEQFMPVRLDLRALFNPAFNYSNFLLPGLLIAILQQVILLGMALSWTGEKEAGSLGELFALSKNPVVLFVGKSLPYLLINFVVAEVYLRVLFPLNDIPMEGDWFVAIPFTLLFVVTIVSWASWVSGLCRTRLFATQLLMFVAMPSFILSGFTWPREGMPAGIQFLSYLLPMTYFVESFRPIYLAAVPFRHVLPNSLALVGFTVFNVIAALFIIRILVRRESLRENPV